MTSNNRKTRQTSGNGNTQDGSRAGAVARLLLGAVTVGLLFLAAWARLTPEAVDYEVGDIATKTIRAPRSGVYIDPEEMQRLREEAADSVDAIYSSVPNATERAVTAVDDVFERFNDVRESAEFEDALSRLSELENTVELNLSNETLRLVVRETTQPTALMRVHDEVVKLVRQQMSKPIRDDTDDLQQAREQIRQKVEQLGLNAPFEKMAKEIASTVLRPNRLLDREATRKAREEKRQSVQAVRHSIQAGDIIVVAGDKISGRHIAAFEAVGLKQARLDYGKAAGVLVASAAMVFLLGLVARRFGGEAYERFPQLLVVAAVLVATAFVYRAVAPEWFDPGAVTAAAAASMIVALLVNVPMGLAMAVATALFLPIAASAADARLTVITAFSSTLGVFLVSRSGSKGRVIALAAPLMAAWCGGMMLAGSAVFPTTVDAKVILATGVGGLLSPLLAVGAAMGLERALGITTDFQLLELSNPNEPLLQRLIREAPGTYQSSVMVANLAEPAAEAIGANGLLVRVGALYHDVGKVQRPYFFVENQFGADNPHDELSPSLSALVIISHAKDGLELAEEHGLPDPIRDIIAQLHGTSLVKYFYQRAREQADNPENVQESNFRYPGPKPETREAALLMLADTVEAAVRTMDNPDRHEIQETVDRLVESIIEDGQLDEAPLSFKDLAVIKRQFVNTLTSVFHRRIEYPEEIEREAEDTE